MAKFFSLALVLAVVAVCTGLPARLKNVRQSRFSARQEQADDLPSQTPYPPAGIKPDVPFELPNEQQEPQEPIESIEPEEPFEGIEPEAPQEPDNTYLPPDNLLPPAETYGPPDQFYGPPEARGNGEADQAAQPEEPQGDEPLDDENVEPESEGIEDPQSERLILARRSRKQSVRPAKLRSAKLQVIPAARVRSQRLIARPVYSNSGALVAYKVLRV